VLLSGLNTLFVEAGCLISPLKGRIGRSTKLPLQFGQILLSFASIQFAHMNVHSYEQILASVHSGGKSTLQHSQFGFNVSIENFLRVRAIEKSRIY
jgi:hypothetical protein